MYSGGGGIWLLSPPGSMEIILKRVWRSYLQNPRRFLRERLGRFKIKIFFKTSFMRSWSVSFYEGHTEAFISEIYGFLLIVNWGITPGHFSEKRVLALYSPLPLLYAHQQWSLFISTQCRRLFYLNFLQACKQNEL